MIDTTNLKEAVKPFFDKLGIDEMDFNYNEKTGKFVSTEAFSYDDDDPLPYFVVIRVYNNAGTVVIGTSDGLKFAETEVLGQIYFENGKWNTL